MPRTIEKIVLSVVFIIIVGFNALFIFGQQDAAAVNDGATKEKALQTLQTKSTTVNEQVAATQTRSEDKDRDDDDEAGENDEEVSAVTLANLQQTTGIITEERAKQIAQNLIPGTVVDFDAEHEDGKLIYDVSIAAQGDIAEVEIDAATGDVLEVEWGED